MGKHEGDAMEEPPPAVPRGRLIKLALGATLGMVAWGYLVTAAVHFGGEGRDGDGRAWMFLAFATVGATACLFVVFSLGSKALAILRGQTPPPPVPGGGKRAAR